jgi:hypothetical protein
MVVRQFKGQTIVIDGKTFDGVKFTDCTLVYRGGQPPNLIRCTFSGVRFVFDDAAGRTLALMRHLYHGGFRPVVENTIANIRTPPSPHDDTVH